MKAILLLLLVSSSLQYQDSKMESRWKLYKMTYDLSFGPLEDSWRKEIWMKNFEEILEHNRDPNQLTWKEGPFEHMEEDERRSFLKPIEEFPVFGAPEGNYSISDAPTTNWLDYLGPAENQGNCSSCYAFAGKALLEALYNQAHNYSKPTNRVRLSAQAIVSCSTNSKCAKGAIVKTLKYLQSPGLPYESAYPYTATNGTCHSFETVARIKNYFKVNENKNAFTLELKNSPIGLTMDWDLSLDRYDGKTVYGSDGNFPCDRRNTRENPLQHTLLLVGYGVENDHPYWHLRNSHGTRYGDNGYLKFAMTSENHCHIYDFGTIAEL